jgi:hypothetical protein
MTDESERPAIEPGDAAQVDRTWNSGGVGNQIGDERETSDATWNPGGVGNASEEELTLDLDDPDAAEAAGE